MRITIFGASGRIGSKLVAEMLGRGHSVKAFVYGPSHFEAHDRLQVMQGDIHNAKDIDKALEDTDVVMSALGSWGTQTKDILSSAMQHIVPSMKKHKLTRIISLTGADARDSSDEPDALQRATHWLFMRIAPKIMQDGEKHIDILRASDLDWTVVRSPVMTDRGKHGSPRLDFHPPRPWAKIHRADVVTAMCDLAESREHLQATPFIHRS